MGIPTLPDLLESIARVRVLVAGVLKGTRRAIDFTSSDASVTITATDDGLNEKVVVDLVASGGGGGDTLWQLDGGLDAVVDLNPTNTPAVDEILLSPTLSPLSRTIIDIVDTGGASAITDYFITINAGSLFGRMDSDIDLYAVRDYLIGAGGNVDVTAASDVNITATSGSVEITAPGDADLTSTGMSGAQVSSTVGPTNIRGFASVNIDQLDGTGSVVITAHANAGTGAQITIEEDIDLFAGNGGGVNLSTAFGGDVSLIPDGDVNIQPATGGVYIQVTGGNYIQMVGLPTVNPGGSGRVWNNGGVLNIT